MASSSKTSHLTKWREISRICDACLSKQIHCDGRDVPGHHCSACLGSNRKCTYVKLHKALEEQLHRMEALLRNTKQSVQNAEVAAHVNQGPNVAHLNEAEFSREPDSWHELSSVGKTTSSPTGTLSHNILNILQTDDFRDGLKHLQADNEYTALEGIVDSDSYLDDTSLLSDALKLKYRAGSDSGSPYLLTSANLTRFPKRRIEFWESQKWEQNALSSPHQIIPDFSYVFPEEDLLATLVQHYFEDANWILPVLHRPTFEAALANNMHLTDDGFARVVLLVCAVGSAYLDDRRVLTDPSSGHWHTAGVRWFEQVVFSGHTAITHPSLYDLQAYCLASIFLHTSPEPHVHWTLMSMGIRLAQEIGIHRRRVYNGPPNAYDEQWKRAFWVLFLLDIWTAWSLGRPRAMRDEDIDVELPIEVDDEYWYHPDPVRCFEQPPGKPSLVTGFNQMIAIMRILGVALRVLYSAKRSRHIHGPNGPGWEDSHLKQLSAALDEWQARLPAHLHWNASQSNLQWFRQSALLRCCYYNGQLTTYRPFLPRKAQQPGSEADASQTTALRALQVSILAARSLAQTVHAHFSRTNEQSPFHIHAAFQAGMFLLLNQWTTQRLWPMEVEKIRADAEHVNHCMEVLKICEIRWPLAGKYWDLLDELANTSIPAPPIKTP